MTKQSKAETVLFFLTFIWGSTFVAMKIGFRDFSPILMTAARFAITSLFFLLFFSRKIFPLPKGALFKGIALGVFLFLGATAQNIGLNYTSISKSAFITSLMVVLVPFLQFIIARRSPTVGNALGISIVVAGLWQLTSPSGSEFNIGDALTLVCAILFAVYIVYLDVASKAMSPVQLTFLQSASTASLGLVAAFGFETILFNPTSSMFLAVGYLTLFATILTTFMQTKFQKDTTPTRAAIIFTIEPVWASSLAYFILDEQLGWLGVLGGALIITGVTVSELSDRIPVLNRSLVSSGL